MWVCEVARTEMCGLSVSVTVIANQYSTRNLPITKAVCCAAAGSTGLQLVATCNGLKGGCCHDQSMAANVTWQLFAFTDCAELDDD